MLSRPKIDHEPNHPAALLYTRFPDVDLDVLSALSVTGEVVVSIVDSHFRFPPELVRDSRDRSLEPRHQPFRSCATHTTGEDLGDSQRCRFHAVRNR